MKKIAFILLITFLSSCNNHKNTLQENDDTLSNDTVHVIKSIATKKEIVKEYSNARFRNVTALKVDENTFGIKGEAQVFEATLNWEVEDGHNILKSGFQTADAGAPEWGKFNFSITVKKESENSTLHLILYEISAEDGNRQNELPIPLP